MATGSTERRRFAEVVESWTGRGVLVVGDAMLDEWRFTESDRLCREAPAPVLTLRRRIASAGGAANAAVNLTALGAHAALVAPVGADVAGDELHDCLDRAGVCDRTVTQEGRPTPVKRRLLAADQILVREDEGNSDEPLPQLGVRRLLTALSCAVDELRAETGGPAPTLVICDYGLGALPEPVRAWLISHRGRFATVALDAHDLAHWQGLAPTVVTPSFAEAIRFLDGPGRTGGARATATGPLGRSTSTGPAAGATASVNGPAAAGGRVTVVGPEMTAAGTEVAVAGTDGRVGSDEVALTGDDRARLARSRLAELRDRTGAKVVAVTLDTDGAVVGDADGNPERSHARPVPASYAVGAGDAYLATMALALTVGTPLATATQLAQLAATTTVSDTGTCVCRRESLLAALGSAEHDDGSPIVVDHAGLAELVAGHRRAGRSVVFTNGCFDVLHPGHVRYLAQAASLGDLLVVAVNSDDSVRRLKGPDRPVNPVDDRVAVLAALSCVDHVVVFGEDSPTGLIETVRPDVYVKGGDYPPEMVPEAPLVRRLGGQVRTLGYVADRSTSAIIDRIRAQGEQRSGAAGRSPEPAGHTPAPEPAGRATEPAGHAAASESAGAVRTPLGSPPAP
ncbi:D-glycero-beta-D-manno-heptose 1-phosphate adenylyltransferase [Solwaraspora sp. WMMD1047]|uniref:D-glycero-beta-D-manno-heptose 1-phosphate adenylyltransferase n=1 Tax=Solwaraspora sp. WMMD1047 TaxID=3016102 RepID=UPI0024172D6C|nr:D-glycero-beta-D-manno-heptose 1-phosphate adenylyltransferase [Solwaraspora sp. WMMD1047]MDG4833820.1 D-glycero-beta-D-manno-heptose 1-phosphate adenylyltransferase [Solwaraspora sp. WMMD1047]